MIRIAYVVTLIAGVAATAAAQNVQPLSLKERRRGRCRIIRRSWRGSTRRKPVER